MTTGELRDSEIFLFMDNLVFERIFYKGTSKNNLLFDVVLRIHKVQMRG